VIVSPAPQIVDQQGNINLQGRCGQAFAVMIPDPNTGVPTFIANLQLVFEIDGIATIPLTVGSGPACQTLTITDEIAQKLPLQSSVGWVLKMVGPDGVSPALRSGVISATGFNAAPPN
jgi:hypothetical protein